MVQPEGVQEHKEVQPVAMGLIIQPVGLAMPQAKPEELEQTEVMVEIQENQVTGQV